MLAATNALFAELLENVFPAWLNCAAIQYLLSFAVIAAVFRLLLTFVRR